MNGVLRIEKHKTKPDKDKLEQESRPANKKGSSNLSQFWDSQFWDYTGIYCYAATNCGFLILLLRILKIGSWLATHEQTGS